MTKISTDNWNMVFSKYPMTITDKGWVYGVWYVGTAWQKVKLHGQYPPGFLKRALALFPEARDVLHAPSGSIIKTDVPPGHVTLDIISDSIRKPDFVADCASMPFNEKSFDLVLSDPPYTVKDSEKYGCDQFPLRRFMEECHRVLRPGGHLGFLHTYYPSYKRKTWRLVGLIAVVTGFQRATRMFSILEALK